MISRARAWAYKERSPGPERAARSTHRPATVQRIRIGATQDGKITAIAHESWSGDLPGGKPNPLSRRRDCSTPALIV